MKHSNPIPPAIADRLQAAQADTTAVGKASRNDFAKYDYTSAEEVLLHVSPILAAHGLGMFRTKWEQERWTVTHDGEPCIMVRSWIQLHASGLKESWVESFDWPIVVSKGRPTDKARASSLTDSLKYWILGILLIPRADIEMDQRPDTVAHGQRTSAPAKAGSKSKAVSNGQI
tara:strand:- start:148 stop:666 length:519 start_codon:yes stop_codon:yes gene_type:complete